MYSLLVVDDEKYAVWGISRGISWSELGIENIYEAFDSESAMNYLNAKAVDVVISDIEMPNQSGLTLLKWINENKPEVKLIFLTAYADFNYAREAIELGSYNYLLKPIDHDSLKESVKKVLDDIASQRESSRIEELYAKHYSAWEKYVPIAVDSFWCSILDGNRQMTDEYLKSTLELYDIPLEINDKIRPIMVSIEGFEESISGKEEEILIHAVSEYISKKLFSEIEGTMLHYDNGILLLIYNEPISLEDLKDTCTNLSKIIKNELLCSLSFYIGDNVGFKSLADEYGYLIEMEQSNTEIKQSVYTKDFKMTISKKTYDIPAVHDWISLLNWGKKDEFNKKLNNLMDTLDKKHIADITTLLEAYEGLCYIFLRASRRNGILMKQVPGVGRYDIIKSKKRLKEWALRTTVEYFSAFTKVEKMRPKIVKKVEKFVKEHISEDFHRDDIAKALYYNSAYLSRMFKSETGISLNEFVNKVRLGEAKKMLEETNLPISHVANKTGYSNFSYFTKQFKENYGVTPSEYKKELSDE